MRPVVIILVALVVSPFTGACGSGVIPEAPANTMIITIGLLPSPDHDVVGAVVVTRAGDFDERSAHASFDRLAIDICPSAACHCHRPLQDSLAAPPTEPASFATVLRI